MPYIPVGVAGAAACAGDVVAEVAAAAAAAAVALSLECPDCRRRGASAGWRGRIPWRLQRRRRPTRLKQQTTQQQWRRRRCCRRRHFRSSSSSCWLSLSLSLPLHLIVAKMLETTDVTEHQQQQRHCLLLCGADGASLASLLSSSYTSLEASIAIQLAHTKPLKSVTHALHVLMKLSFFHQTVFISYLPFPVIRTYTGAFILQSLHPTEFSRPS